MNAARVSLMTHDDLLRTQILCAAEPHFHGIAPAVPIAPGNAPLLPAATSENGSSRQVVWIDLRDAGRWSQLEELADPANHRGEPRPYLIGIVEQAIPLAQTLHAQQWLDQIVPLPLDAEHIQRLLNQAAEAPTRSEASNHWSLRSLVTSGERIVTRTPRLFALFDQVKLIAQRDLTALLIGETGTGKTTLAKIIHGLSPRCQKNFTNVACGTLQTELIDSALFGHVRGAFTGADSNQEGKFAAAKEGTLLLDEIDLLGLQQQARLLRVLETGQYESLGSNDTKTTNARIVVATNQPLKPLMEQGRFRPDLYFRLNQVTLEIPPLRNRPLDILPLALQFIEQSAERNQITIHGIHPEVLPLLENYSWPGNVRELRNEITRAVLFARQGIIDSHALSVSLRQSEPSHRHSEIHYGLAGEVATTEQAAIERMLKEHRFNRTATAKALGISRVTLYNKIRRYQIQIDALQTMEHGHRPA